MRFTSEPSLSLSNGAALARATFGAPGPGCHLPGPPVSLESRSLSLSGRGPGAGQPASECQNYYSG